MHNKCVTIRQTHVDDDWKRNRVRYVVYGRPDLYGETEKSNSVYGFACGLGSADELVCKVVRRMEAGRQIFIDSAIVFDVGWNPKESWQICTILYNIPCWLLMVFQRETYFASFLFWLAPVPRTRVLVRRRFQKSMVFFWIFVYFNNNNISTRKNNNITLYDRIKRLVNAKRKFSIWHKPAAYYYIIISIFFAIKTTTCINPNIS